MSKLIDGLYERKTEQYGFFLRGPFSNFQYCPSLIIDNIKFANTEQAFMYYKALHFKDNESMEKIKNETNPYKAKQLGRLVKGYVDSEWDSVRYKYMLKVNMAKYTQNSNLFDSLINTKNLILVETNPRDNIWAIGLSADDNSVLDQTKWKGQNLLGKVLMEIREYFYKLKG